MLYFYMHCVASTAVHAQPSTDKPWDFLTQVTTALGAILRATQAKQLPCGVFGSFGWSGEAVDEMEARLRDAGFQFGFEPIRVKFKPTPGQLQVISTVLLGRKYDSSAAPS